MRLITLKQVNMGWVVIALLGTMAYAMPVGQRSTNDATISWRDRDAGFGRPETLTGTIAMANPEEGLLVVKRQGPNLPPTTEIIETETPAPDAHAVANEDQVSVVPGPGEADYRFRLTNSTLVRVNGQRLTLADLATLVGRQATVYFVPRRSGNYVQGIEVSE